MIQPRDKKFSRPFDSLSLKKTKLKEEWCRKMVLLSLRKGHKSAPIELEFSICKNLKNKVKANQENEKTEVLACSICLLLESEK